MIQIYADDIYNFVRAEPDEASVLKVVWQMLNILNHRHQSRYKCGECGHCSHEDRYLDLMQAVDNVRKEVGED